MTIDRENALSEAARRLIEAAPLRAAELLGYLMIEARASVPKDDEGQKRLVHAQLQRTAVERAMARITATHGISADALTRRHKAKQKPHVVDARANLVADLYATGLFSYPELAVRLGYSTHHAVMHLRDKWLARQAGTDEAVSDREALEAHRLTRDEGMTLREAAAALEINHAKLRGRISWMKEAGGWPASKEIDNDQ